MLLLTMKQLSPRGWSSSDVVMGAKNELLKSKLIQQTVQGRRPNKASLYAITWLSDDDSGALDG